MAGLQRTLSAGMPPPSPSYLSSLGTSMPPASPLAAAGISEAPPLSLHLGELQPIVTSTGLGASEGAEYGLNLPPTPQVSAPASAPAAASSMLPLSVRVCIGTGPACAHA